MSKLAEGAAAPIDKVLKVVSCKDFFASLGYPQIAPTTKVNANGYPFITFGKVGSGENIYFSRKAASAILPNTPVTKELFKAHQIGYTTNEAGEERIKLISISERIESSDLFD